MEAIFWLAKSFVLLSPLGVGLQYVLQAADRLWNIRFLGASESENEPLPRRTAGVRGGQGPNPQTICFGARRYLNIGYAGG